MSSLMMSHTWRILQKMSRKKARIRLMQYIFELDAKNVFKKKMKSAIVLELLRADTIAYEEIQDQVEYFEKVLVNIVDNIADIDRRINEKALKWDIKRMPKVDLAICRLSTCEMLFHSDDITDAISINEAVEMAKKYSTGDSPKYVNAVLGKVAGDINKSI